MSDHRVLRYVITVSEEGGFTAAARKLNIAQSAISHPVMISLGFDDIWFGVFVVHGAFNGQLELSDVFRGLAPYFIAGMFMLLLICIFPEIALYLPNTMRN